MIAAVTILAWATISESCALMFPVLVAVAAGFYAMLRGRQQVYSIAAYAEERLDEQGPEAGWLTRVVHIPTSQGFSPGGDWIVVGLANGMVLLTVAFAWLLAETAWRGELMSGILTGCGIVFAFHSISETARLPHVVSTARLHQARGGPRRAVGE